ncbi:hypothetical protein LEP1GSC161_1447 [Leptospira santarosai str. CBC1416]|uniref:Uncharacterized protein n=1 Tax=Leptospira santarosai str. CBC1416 TaxID=1193059 RepID=M6VVX7_9LEPT|nr:hypothetical protein LEP1GSC161_1447 [Leptospira santarosai str. CBC1416]
MVLKELRENNGSQIKMNLTSGRLLNVVEKEKKEAAFMWKPLPPLRV